MSPTQPSPGASRWTEVDAAAFDAAHQAHLADRAHDPDPALWRQYHDLLALERLEPLPAQREPDAGDRMESLAEAAGVFVPAYEQSLPPEMRYAEPEADQNHLDRVQADYLADMRASQPEATP